MSPDDMHPSSILFKNRIIFLFGPINQDTVADIVPRLLVMNSLGTEPIKLFLNSPGGEVTAGLAIYDTMRFIQAPVYTICIGQAASMATWLLAAGAPGNRVATENAQIMIHQGRTLMGGTYADLKISMEEFERIQQRMVNILSRHTGKKDVEIVKSIDRDYWMTPEEALEFGIIDRIVGNAE